MKHTYFNIPGWFNYSETYDVIVDRIEPNGKIIEIGSFLGRSTHYLATSLFNANKFDVQVYCIDTVSYTHLRAHETREDRGWPVLR